MAATVDLEMALSRVLMKARVIERAIHDVSTAWRIEVAGDWHPTYPEFTETGVSFSTGTLCVPYEGAEVVLCHNGEIVFVAESVESAEADEEIVIDISLVETPALT